MYTRYIVFDKDHKIERDFSEKYAACFYSYNYDGKHTKDRIIHVLLAKKSKPRENIYGDICSSSSYHTPFTRKQIKDYLDQLKEVFPTTLEENEDDYVVVINEKDYISKTQVRAALDFIRVLFEEAVVLKYYLEHKEEFKDKEYFVALQEIGKKQMTQHGLPSYRYDRGIFTSKGFMKALKDSANKQEGSAELWRKAPPMVKG